MTKPTMSAGPPAGPSSADEAAAPRDFWKELLISVATQSWLASMAFHMVLMIVLALIMGTIHVVQTIGDAPAFDAADQMAFEPELARFEVGSTPIENTVLDTDSLRMIEPSLAAEFNDNSPIFEKAGGGAENSTTNLGGLGVNISSNLIGPALKGAGGLDPGLGSSANAGKGGAGSGFAHRGSGSQKAIGSGVTKQSERAVGAALNWFSRHQNRDGSWSIRYVHNCKGGSCSCPGESYSDTGATALSLLPFLAAGQTHQTKGPYQRHINSGIGWLITHQKVNGDLSTGGVSPMYGHGMATIALCECYGLTQDPKVGYAAQKAIDFIEAGQNAEGGWRYTHGTDQSDTSVFGWQVMSLKSAQMAGLKVNPAVLEKCKKYLDTCATGEYHCQFSYAPGGGPTTSTTGIGLLMKQYLGTPRTDPVIANGMNFLMEHKPELAPHMRDTYYWYHATQVLHNAPGKQWDEWNRHTRRLLIESQDTEGCAAGSWNPERPEQDRWSNEGGRLMITSLSTLTLEIYYRYLPLYKLDTAEKQAKAK